MNKYIVSTFLSGKVIMFRCLFAVKESYPRDDSDDFYKITKVLVDDSNGKLVFRNILDIISYKFRDSINFNNEYTTLLYAPKDRSSRNLLVEFENDETALLWYKLNY